MGRILLLDNRKGGGYPEAFQKADLPIPDGEDRQTYLENRILRALNEFQPKLGVEGIEYGDIKKQFPRAKAGITSGVIVEEVRVGDTLVETYERRIRAYVYLPLPSAEDRSEGRNTLMSQTLFPTLIDYMEEYLASPCFAPTNHPIYLINASWREITAATILENIASFAFIGIFYIDVFQEQHRNYIDLSEVPRDLKLFLEQYDAQYRSCYRESEDRFENPYMRIDFAQRHFAVKKEGIVDRLIRQDGHYNFNGSGEKFYWMMIYPMTIAAHDQGFRVDISEYREFCEQYGKRFAAGSEKMRRCRVLLRYLEKYTGQRDDNAEQ